MDVSLQVARFLYRLRFKLLLPSIFVSLIVMYFTQFLPREYTVEASVFTGIASNKGLNDDARSDYLTLNNTFDNVISYTKSKGSLEKVSMKLLAQSLMFGSIIKDNNIYITSKNYISLLDIVPDEVLALVDKNSIDITLKNFQEYKLLGIDNFFYQIYNSTNYRGSYYSYEVINSISIHRVNSSDLINLSYTSDDPGMASNTVKLITEELIKSHDTFRYKSSNEVVEYYEEQLRISKLRLNELEDELMNYNIENRVISYADQAKELAIVMSEFEVRYDQVLIEYARSQDLIGVLESQLIVRNLSYRTNAEFLESLNQVTAISGEIAESEMFSTDGTVRNVSEDQKQQQRLAVAVKHIEDITGKMSQTQYSKEGVVLDDIVGQWLNAMINLVKAKADLRVLDNRRKYYEMQQGIYSPIGTHLSRMKREINVVEQTYLNTLDDLGVARQHNNSIKLESSSPEIVTPAIFPASSNGRKRHIFVLVAFLATLILITAIEVILEKIDRTLRDPLRANRLTSLKVLGALLGPKQFRYRGYVRDNNRVSVRAICNKLNYLLCSEKTLYVNVLSMKSDEGKSFVTKYMKNEWEEQGLVVDVLNYEEDYLCDINYLLAQSLNFFTHKQADVVFIEYPPLSQHSVPPVFLRDASINILVVNANRGWKISDDECLKSLHKGMGNEFLLILNNTRLDYVEDLIGELPINRRALSLADRLKDLTFTGGANGIQ